MRDLVPNSPAGRFEHVIKTYWGKPLGKPAVGDVQETLDGVVLDVFAVTINLVGAEGTVRMPSIVVSHEIGDISVRFDTHELSVERIQKALDGTGPKIKSAKEMLARLGHPYEYNDQGNILWSGDVWGLASLVIAVTALPAHNPTDFLVPWIARELVTLARAIVDAQTGNFFSWKAKESRGDYYAAVHTLMDKAPAIAQWAKESRTDIGKIDLATALETIATYKFKTSLVEQGTIVFRYADGWTVQELRTERALSQEGKNMQNCVGGYCETVEKGEARIYSVRDPSGQPHVTMELVPPKGPPNYGADLEPEDFVRSEKRLLWHFEQVLGKQNDAPTAAYRDRAREFVDKAFEKEGLGWCVTGGTSKWARFAKRQLNDINFDSVIGVNHVDNDVLAGASFFDANLTGCNFAGLVLEGTDFEKARLSDADLNGSGLSRAKLDGAQCHFTKFRYATLAGTRFDSAHLGGADFTGAHLDEATFRAARVDGAVFENAKSAEGADWTDVDLTTNQRHQLGLPVEMKHYDRDHQRTRRA